MNHLTNLIRATVMLLCFSYSAQGVIVQMSPYDGNGWTSSLTTTGSSGQVTFQLLYDTLLNQNKGSEFVYTFSVGSLTVGRSFQAPTADVAGDAGGTLAMTSGMTIGPATNWTALSSISGSDWSPDGTVSYIGLRVNPAEDHATYYYGWLKMRWNSDTSITLFDWAYESEPNHSIVAGAVPEPNSILLSGFTVAILTLSRRRMSKQQVEEG